MGKMLNMTFAFKMDWDNAIEQALIALGPALMDATAQEIARRAKQPPPVGSPFDTGTNRRSIIWRNINGRLWVVATTSGYGGFLELGTSKMPARPYLKPSFEWARAHMPEISRTIRIA